MSATGKVYLKAIFHCSRFARAGGATNFNHVKNQSPGHTKKVECSSTFMACPRAFRRTKDAQVRQLQRKLRGEALYSCAYGKSREARVKVDSKKSTAKSRELTAKSRESTANLQILFFNIYYNTCKK